jgi:Tol biopolymer transport system component
MFTSFAIDRDGDSPAQSSWRWALPAAAALVASFAVGFGVMDGIIDRRAATEPARSARLSPRVSAANQADVEVKAEIVRVPRTAAGAREIVSPLANAFSPAFASDDRFLAFDSDRDGERGIDVANGDGSQVRRISGAGYAAVPTWSRNSQWLAYISAEPDKPSVWNLWVQPAAGGSARRVTSYQYGQTWAASWFPDDRRIAYSHQDMLIVMDLKTGEATRYRTPVKGQLVRTPAVSPDGTQIIFQVFRHGAWLLDLSDGSMRRVLDDPTAEEFAWAPDGRRVAFHSHRDDRWGIYVLSRS